MPDLTAYTDDDLDALRIAVAVEQERRATAAAAPARMEDMARQALDAGADPSAIRAAVEDGLTPPQQALTVRD